MKEPALLCDAKNSLLLVIDIQERLASAMPDKVLETVVKHTGWLIQTADMLNIPVVRTEQYPKGLGDTIKDVQQHLTMDTCLEKTSFSCCGAEGFTQAVNINKHRQIVIAGIESHVCVLQTAVDLLIDGFDVFVAGDAVCSRDKQNHKNALQRLNQLGATISNTESVMFEWLRDASHPQFKAVSKLLR